MKKFALLSVSALVAFGALVETSSVAEARKRGFFEFLFNGDRPSRRTIREPQWWEEDDSRDYRVIRPGDRRKKKKLFAFDQQRLKPKPKIRATETLKPKVTKRKAIPVVSSDPDIDEGLGMGNLVYAPLKMMAVYDPGFSSLVTTETENSFIRLVLADKGTNIRATEDVRKAVLAHYQSTGFKPLWTENGNMSVRGLQVLEILSQAGQHGLEPLRYKPAVLERFEGSAGVLDGDGLGLAQFDVGLTVAVITYAMHQSGGAFEPERLSAYHDIRTHRVSPEAAMRVLAYSPFPAEYLKGLEPKLPAYQALKAELVKLESTPVETQPQFADGKRIRIGQKDPRIQQLRARLIKDGYISLTDATVDPEKRSTLDKVLAKGLKRFQEAKGVAQTSNLDSATIKALNGSDFAGRRDKVISSMERVRWLPLDMGSRYVLVNQAGYRATLTENGEEVWASNIIVGKALTQTHVFSDTFETVVFNPTWGVPASIIQNEYLPKLRANPGYLDKIGFQVVNSKGKRVSSRSVDWYSVSATNIGIVQPAGDGNALGEVKFLFPNKHSIYMHDTPTRKLFKESKRNFSHGCVRVENPRDFAQVLLGWDRDKIDSSIDGGESSSVKVTTKTNVHLSYFTAWPGENGEIQYYSDAYGRDETLKQARAQVFKQSGGIAGAKLVENDKATILPVSE